MEQIVEAEKKRSQRLSKETDDIIFRGDRLTQKFEAMEKKMNLIDPLINSLEDKLHSY